jgi:hypothetical protein
MRASLVLAVVLVALVGASCSADRTLDVASLESTLRQQLGDLQSQAVEAVDCPDEIKVEAHTSFTCTATGGEMTWTLQVTQDDDEGSVTWKIVDAPQHS